jgi:hypothetical protein
MLAGLKTAAGGSESVRRRSRQSKLEGPSLEEGAEEASSDCRNCGLPDAEVAKLQ